MKLGTMWRTAAFAAIGLVGVSAAGTEADAAGGYLSPQACQPFQSIIAANPDVNGHWRQGGYLIFPGTNGAFVTNGQNNTNTGFVCTGGPHGNNVDLGSATFDYTDGHGTTAVSAYAYVTTINDSWFMGAYRYSCGGAGASGGCTSNSDPGFKGKGWLGLPNPTNGTGVITNVGQVGIFLFLHNYSQSNGTDVGTDLLRRVYVDWT